MCTAPTAPNTAPNTANTAPNTGGAWAQKKKKHLKSRLLVPFSKRGPIAIAGAILKTGALSNLIYWPGISPGFLGLMNSISSSSPPSDPLKNPFDRPPTVLRRGHRRMWGCMGGKHGKGPGIWRVYGRGGG